MPEEVAAFNSSIKKEESQISLPNTKNILDTLIIMANSDKLLQELSDLKVDTILENVITRGSDELNTLILVVNSQIITARMGLLGAADDELPAVDPEYI